ncbi:helix-turn-helix domain-containing protein [Cupriavidus basilensis]|uniref:Helix-turn-helix domain-containing protein n=1 Tax=Cupriavidus basilensis TaxID=68895 RepID=A0ABT6AWW4_9BURK|nr:helix-turn-helix domain-containing protein [Cupriavidus basilensis]MDF3836727.1 helix-turn-helix domain-containing protein [Cupriavidus basilensis]
MPAVQSLPQNMTRTTNMTFDQWREAIDTSFLPLEYSRQGRGPFHCKASYARFGACAVADMEVDAHRVAREPRHAAASDAGFFKIFWQLSGRSRVAQRGNEASLEPGMWSIYDTAQPYSIEMADRCRVLVLLVPQERAFGWRQAAASLGGRALRGEGAARIAVSALGALLHDACAGHLLDQQGQLVLQDSMVALMETALQGAHAPPPPALGDGTDAVMARHLGEARINRIASFVDAHLHDPELSAQSLAAVLNVSRRTLYNLFREFGQTPHAYILSRRLRQAALRLSGGGEGGRSITEIAFALGFADAAHFSRVFHERFGMSPSQWRQQHAGGRGVAVRH